jgi:2-phospho-L-lactate guanylyltransferase
MDAVAAPWVVVVPVKRLDRAKSRLAGAAGRWRAALALAMAHDTVDAALRSGVLEVVVVSDDEDARAELADAGAVVIADRPSNGINAAVVYGASDARTRLGDVGVAALSADLPALRSAELSLALRRAGDHDRAFLVDHAGSGTVLYAASAGAAFRPAFGSASAQAHAQSASRLDPEGLASLRLDVDTIDDLRAAARLGLGGRTKAIAAHLLGGDELSDAAVIIGADESEGDRPTGEGDAGDRIEV